MRRFRPERMELGEVPTAYIRINPRSRADVPKILRGIRSLVSNGKFRTGLENPKEAGFLPGANGGQGCPGMDLRRIFIFGVLEQGLGRDFGRNLYHANHDNLVRTFLGHADFIGERECKRRTPADNIRHPRHDPLPRGNAAGDGRHEEMERQARQRNCRPALSI